MQTSVPEVMNFSDEPESSFKLYGPDSLQPGTFAANCLLARRLSERGVRFIQLYHMGGMRIKIYRTGPVTLQKVSIRLRLP